jgi:hypothetical protein
MIWEKARLFAIYMKGNILIEWTGMIMATVAGRGQEKNRCQKWIRVVLGR